MWAQLLNPRSFSENTYSTQKHKSEKEMDTRDRVSGQRVGWGFLWISLLGLMSWSLNQEHLLSHPSWKRKVRHVCHRTQTLSKIPCKLCWAVSLSRRTGWLMSKSAGFRIGQAGWVNVQPATSSVTLSKQQTCWAFFLTRKIRKMHQPSLYGQDYMRSCGQVLHRAWVVYSQCSRYQSYYID